MSRMVALIDGVLCHAFFLVTFPYAVESTDPNGLLR